MQCPRCHAENREGRRFCGEFLAGQDRGREARQMLAEIYSWFTEGFDTVALQEAKALLEELNH